MPWGPAEVEFNREARVHSAQALTLIAIVIQSAALLVSQPGRLGEAVAALVVMVTWRAVALIRLSAGPAIWVLWVDTALVSALGLLQPVLDVPSLVRDDCGWVFLLVEATAVAYQWQFERRPAMVATVITSAAYLAGALAMGELSGPTAAGSTVWLLLTGVVSRWIRESIRIAARRADEAGAEHERAKRETEVATALRESELEHLAKLHDTVAATLMMVGLGAAGSGTALREQAGRDLAVLTSSPVVDPGSDQDVVEQLAAVIRSSALEVTFTRHGPEIMPPRSVAEALAGALGESLRNVARHAEVDHALVELDMSGEQICVRVRDDGRGFTEGARPGRGIRHSITARMARAGGRATVTSSPGGVLVELLWPDRPATPEPVR